MDTHVSGSSTDLDWLRPFLQDPVAVAEILDAIPFGVHLVAVDDGHMTVVGMNQAAASAFPGGAASVGRDLADVVDRPQRERTLQRYRRVHETGTSETTRLAIDLAGGAHLVVEVVLLALPQHVLALSFDLTEPVAETEAATAYSKAILQASPDLIWVATRDLQIRHFQGGEPIPKMQHAMAVGRNLADVFPPEAVEEARVLIERTLDTGTITVAENITGTGDSARVFETRMVPLGTSEVLSFVREVTDRRRAESTRHRQTAIDRVTAEVSRDLLGAPVDSVPVVATSALRRLAQLDRGRRRDPCKAARRGDLRTCARVVGSGGRRTAGGRARHRQRTLVPIHVRRHGARRTLVPGRRRRPPDDCRDRTRDARVHRCARRVGRPHRADGSRHRVPHASSGVRGLRRTIFLAAYAAIRVVGDTLLTAHVRAEAHVELLETEEQLRVIFDALHEAILLTNADGTVRAANRAAADIFEMPHDDLVGHRHLHSPQEVPIREDGTQFPRAELPTFATLADGQPRVNVVEGMATPDGGRRWVSVNTRPLTRAGHLLPYAVVSSFVDVTEERRLQVELAQAGKMEALGRLAGGVAHDFNNILTAIIGYTALLLEESPGPSETRTDLLEVEAAAQRAAGLVDQLLSFSRRQVVESSLADVRETVDSMLPILERLVPPEVDVEVRALTVDTSAAVDRGGLERVLINLVVNAGDAMPDGGKLVFEIDRVEEHDDAGPFVVLSVADTGSGMDAVTRARVFEPFFTTKAIGKGTGLGLSTTYGIVSQAGGQVTVDSDPGNGSTFRVYLPVSDGRSAPPVTPEPLDGPQTGDETVLVIDDDDTVRALTVETLRRRGYRVLAAASAAEARRAAREHQGRIDLIIADVVLPTTRGPALAAELVRDRPGARVLLMSGYAEGVALDSITERGGFLSKPFRPDDLGRRVREVLDREQGDD